MMSASGSMVSARKRNALRIQPRIEMRHAAQLFQGYAEQWAEEAAAIAR